MIVFSLQEYIADNAIPVFVQGDRILFVLIRYDFRLQHRRLLGIRSYVIELVPAIQVLLYRLTVKENHRNICRHGRINDAGGGRAVHRIDAEGVAAQ